MDSRQAAGVKYSPRHKQSQISTGTHAHPHTNWLPYCNLRHTLVFFPLSSLSGWLPYNAQPGMEIVLGGCWCWCTVPAHRCFRWPVLKVQSNLLLSFLHTDYIHLSWGQFAFTGQTCLFCFCSRASQSYISYEWKGSLRASINRGRWCAGHMAYLDKSQWAAVSVGHQKIHNVFTGIRSCLSLYRPSLRTCHSAAHESLLCAETPLAGRQRISNPHL